MIFLTWLFWLVLVPQAQAAQNLGPSKSLSATEKRGLKLFIQRCAVCHVGVPPSYETYGPPLDQRVVADRGDDATQLLITQGSQRMPGWKYVLSAADIEDIITYLKTVPRSASDSLAKEDSAGVPTLDFEFFKSRVEPIFLKTRPGHTPCYSCHSGMFGPPYLEKLEPGKDFWTDEQSRLIFQRVSRLVVPGNLLSSRLLTHPLAAQAGGDSPPIHRGGRQFLSQDDPDWQTLAQWLHGAKAAPAKQ